MKIDFFKYQGTGNDFILIDNRQLILTNLSRDQVASWCHRRFGVGADGLILLENEPGYDFKMVYYNSDGNESSMCGNGGRCIVKFAHDLGIVQKEAFFLATDGPHKAIVDGGIVSLQMKDVSGIEKIGDDRLLDTGSPHYVRFMLQESGQWDVVNEAKKIRYNDRFKAKGVNVNFVKDSGDFLDVRTYERGVEDETYSCGTGVTAVALVNHMGSEPGKTFTQKIHTPGGELEVSFKKLSETAYSDIWLRGPATFSFEGRLDFKS